MLQRFASIDAERFDHYLSGFQSIVVSLALISGGIWTFFTFRSFRQTTKAQTEISIMEKQLKEQAAIEIQLDAAQRALPDDEAQYIEVTVHIKNVGNRNARLTFKENSALTVRRIHFDDRGVMVTGDILSSGVPGEASGVIVRPISSEAVPFFMRVPGPGLYLLSFHADVSPEEKQVVRDIGAPERAQFSWTGSRFFIVHANSTP